jgi:hypothetical protein
MRAWQRTGQHHGAGLFIFIVDPSTRPLCREPYADTVPAAKNSSPTRLLQGFTGFPGECRSLTEAAISGFLPIAKYEEAVYRQHVDRHASARDQSTTT